MLIRQTIELAGCGRDLSGGAFYLPFAQHMGPIYVNQRPTVSSFQHFEIFREPHTI